MSKKIVFCADGTWNHPDQTEDGLPADTNVYKFFKALISSAWQLPFYDDGAGADGRPVDRLLGGAIGEGLFKKIKDGYSKIAHSYRDGDQMFLIGFSRGAYTVRSLAGMIAICGLPKLEKFSDQTTEDAFQAYRDKENRPTLLPKLIANYGCRDVKIELVGVWDTVGSLGIPGEIFDDLDTKVYGFLNTSLHPDVKTDTTHSPSMSVARNSRQRYGATRSIRGKLSSKCGLPAHTATWAAVMRKEGWQISHLAG